MFSRCFVLLFFFSSRRRHTRLQGDWSSDVCSSDLPFSFLPAMGWPARPGMGQDSCTPTPALRFLVTGSCLKPLEVRDRRGWELVYSRPENRTDRAGYHPAM